MSRLLLSILVLVFAGCAGAAKISQPSEPRDYVRDSNPKMVDIAAACVRKLFAEYTERPSDHVYYLQVLNADCRAVIAHAGVPGIKSFVFGFRDHSWNDRGYFDTETGLRVYIVTISMEDAPPNDGQAKVQVTFDHGTKLGGKSDLYTLERRSGQWIVVSVVNRWIA